MSFLYHDRQFFMYAIGSDDGPQKIGISANIERRLTELRARSPTPLKLLHAQPVEPGRGVWTERRAHEILHRARLGGEWFSVTPDEAIAAIRAAVSAGENATSRLDPDVATLRAPLTPSEFRARLAALGLTQRSFARRICVVERCVKWWLGGKRGVPRFVRLFLDLIEEVGLPPTPALEIHRPALPRTTPAELRSRIEALGFTPQGFGRHIEADDRGVRRWCAGEQDIPRWVGVMLGLLEAAPLRPRSTPPDPTTRVPPFPRRVIGPNLEDDPT